MTATTTKYLHRATSSSGATITITPVAGQTVILRAGMVSGNGAAGVVAISDGSRTISPAADANGTLALGPFFPFAGIAGAAVTVNPAGVSAETYIGYTLHGGG